MQDLTVVMVAPKCPGTEVREDWGRFWLSAVAWGGGEFDIFIGFYWYIRLIYTWWMCIRRKFRSQTSDNMDRWKAELGRGREKRRVEESRSEKRKSQKKEDADARKGRKVAKHCFFPMICGSGGSKSRLAKAAGAEPSMKKCMPLWREAHL